MTSRSCSWCHTTNPATGRFCRSCQHEAHVARLDCQCARCLRARRRAAGTEAPVALAGVVEQTLAGLRHAGHRQDDPPDGAGTAERGTPMPVTRELTLD